MAEKKQLSRRQLAVLEDLFSGGLDEQAVLDKYKISRNLYSRWLANEAFAEQFAQRIDGAYRQSAVLIARYAPLAAAKLVQLTESEKAETARKACLDIISMNHDPSLVSRQTSDEQRATNDGLSAETASRILEILANEKDR